ncbi:26S proteasome non-ATPase regulatory subunit 4 homolog [Rutidosis leptorrhynchoides]|uniref:26S proteasome non-ATPase regulatory subunit 4 homolog n=1 Tax=Rutidosis leptorrhynchoides TaxID=125765 RepID=UPI003A9A4A42
MICIDNSKWMRDLNRYSYGLQLECIRSYCRAKLESNNPKNPKNAIGIWPMGTLDQDNYLDITSDLDEVLDLLQSFYSTELNLGGDLDFIGGIHCSLADLVLDEPSELKRMLLFAGGPTNLDFTTAERSGETLKRYSIAVDVVNFCDTEENRYCKWALDAFVAAADNNNNCTIKHIYPDFSTRIDDVLSSVSTPEEIVSLASAEQEEISTNKNAKHPKEKNQTAAVVKYTPVECKNKFEALQEERNGEEIVSLASPEQGEIPRNKNTKDRKVKNQADVHDEYVVKHSPVECKKIFEALPKERNGEVRQKHYPLLNCTLVYGCLLAITIWCVKQAILIGCPQL